MKFAKQINKKFFGILFFAAIMSFGLVACGGEKDAAEEEVEETMEDAEEATKDMADKAEKKVDEMADSVKDAADSLSDAAKAKMDEMKGGKEGKDAADHSNGGDEHPNN